MQQVLTLVMLLSCLPIWATTKLRLHDSPSSIAGYKAMDLSLGPPNITAVTGVTATTRGGTDVQIARISNGTPLSWISEPLAAGFTLSGDVTCNVYGGEKAAATHAAFRCRLYKYSGGSQGSAIMLGEMATELSTSNTTAHNWLNTTTASGFVTSTAFSTGDRIVLELFVENCATRGCPTGTMGEGTTTIHYDGPRDAADGSSWVQLTETVTFSPDGGSGGIPDIVQWVQTPNLSNVGQTLGAGASITVNYPGPTQSGNLSALCFWYTTGTDWSVTDDSSNTYTLGPTCTGNGYTEACYYATNIASGTRVMTVSHAAGTAVFFGATAAEVKNIALSSALDTSSCNADQSGTTVTAGSITPSSSGDFILQHMFNEIATPTASMTAGSQANITWGLWAAALSTGEGGQYGTYNSTSAINPTMFETDPGVRWFSAAMAFKSSAAGNGPPARMHIRGIQSETFQHGSLSPQTMQFPTKGNLIIDAFQAGGGDYITSITSSPSNTWVNTSAVVSNGTSTIMYYAANATPSLAMTVPATMNQTAASDDTHMWIDVMGANTAPFTTNNVTKTGYKTGITPLDTLTITPTVGTSLVVTTVGVDFNTLDGITNSGCLLQNGFMSVNNAGNTPYYENNGWATCLNHATTAIAFDWTVMGGLGENDGNWAARAAEFLAPASSTTTMPAAVY